jgi:hypothetical protein
VPSWAQATAGGLALNELTDLPPHPARPPLNPDEAAAELRIDPDGGEGRGEGLYLCCTRRAAAPTIGLISGLCSALRRRRRRKARAGAAQQTKHQTPTQAVGTVSGTARPTTTSSAAAAPVGDPVGGSAPGSMYAVD